MRQFGGMEQLVLGACVVCCGTLASVSLFVANLVVPAQYDATSLAPCGFLPSYLAIEAFLWAAVLATSVTVVGCVLTHGTGGGASDHYYSPSSSGISNWLCCTCSCQSGMSALMTLAPFVLGGLCWLHIAFGIGAGAWIGGHSSDVLDCRSAEGAAPVYRLTIANIVLSMLLLLVPAVVATYFAYHNVPRLIELCRRDNAHAEFTAVGSEFDPDTDADLRDDDGLVPSSADDALAVAAGVTRPGSHGLSSHHHHQHDDSHTPDLRDSPQLPADRRVTVAPHTASAFDGGGADGYSPALTSAGGGMSGGYPSAHIHPDDLAFGVGYGSSGTAGSISGVTSPALEPHTPGAYQSIGNGSVAAAAAAATGAGPSALLLSPPAGDYQRDAPHDSGAGTGDAPVGTSSVPAHPLQPQL